MKTTTPLGLMLVTLLLALPCGTRAAPIRMVDAATFESAAVISSSIHGVLFSSFSYVGVSSDAEPLLKFDPEQARFDTVQVGYPSSSSVEYDGFLATKVFLPETSNLMAIANLATRESTGLALSASRQLGHFGLTAFSGSGDPLVVYYLDRQNQVVLEDWSDARTWQPTPDRGYEGYWLYEYNLQQDIRFNTVLFGGADATVFIHRVSFSSVPTPPPLVLMALGVIALGLCGRNISKCRCFLRHAGVWGSHSKG